MAGELVTFIALDCRAGPVQIKHVHGATHVMKAGAVQSTAPAGPVAPCLPTAVLLCTPPVDHWPNRAVISMSMSSWGWVGSRLSHIVCFCVCLQASGRTFQACTLPSTSPCRPHSIWQVRELMRQARRQSQGPAHCMGRWGVCHLGETGWMGPSPAYDHKMCMPADSVHPTSRYHSHA